MSRGRWSAAALPMGCAATVAEPWALCECATCSASALFLSAAPTRAASCAPDVEHNIEATTKQPARVLFSVGLCFYDYSFLCTDSLVQSATAGNVIKMADSILVGVYQIFNTSWSIAMEQLHRLQFPFQRGWVFVESLKKDWTVALVDMRGMF